MNDRIIPPSADVRDAVWRDLSRQAAAHRRRRIRATLTFIAALLAIGALAGLLLNIAIRGIG